MAGALAAALASLVLAGPAAAQTSIQLDLTVCLASDEPGPIDPRAERIDRRLRREFRYESLQLLDSKRERVAVDSVLSLGLPDGRQARVRPLSIDERGALLAVDIEGAVKVDARARSGHLLVFGAGRHAGGRLVVSIEPRF
ncbi:MAG: hypothetical protein VX681_13325 [Myxococcota bacterium]|nr:hypothetical protein [Myxococcota bacterium]